MGDSSIPASEIEKLVERIVAASLEKLLCSDKGKDHVVVEDKENKEEFEKKEQANETWQDEEFFAKKLSNQKAESEVVPFEKLEKTDKKIEKFHVFIKSKGMDQYVDINDNEDEELDLKSTIPLMYKMAKVFKYDGTGDPKVHVQYKAEDSDEEWLNLDDGFVESEDDLLVNPITLNIWSNEEEEETKEVNNMTRSGRVC
ncbi:hypothetical protein JCGZ_22026 [Jatropha curcas]|uniref:Uncharacterized protein n=1 Tax=Jatropha curcas TaxID=180498 RepID=A0A067JT87_JATCU|nr:hypothetical protein JCGZ_22026 [Jatropha curcas]